MVIHDVVLESPLERDQDVGRIERMEEKEKASSKRNLRRCRALPRTCTRVQTTGGRRHTLSARSSAPLIGDGHVECEDGGAIGNRKAPNGQDHRRRGNVGFHCAASSSGSSLTPSLSRLQSATSIGADTRIRARRTVASDAVTRAFGLDEDERPSVRVLGICDSAYHILCKLLWQSI